MGCAFAGAPQFGQKLLSNSVPHFEHFIIFPPLITFYHIIPESKVTLY
jgi:hypothetical protein